MNTLVNVGWVGVAAIVASIPSMFFGYWAGKYDLRSAVAREHHVRMAERCSSHFEVFIVEQDDGTAICRREDKGLVER